MCINKQEHATDYKMIKMMPNICNYFIIFIYTYLILKKIGNQSWRPLHDVKNSFWRPETRCDDVANKDNVIFSHMMS